MPAEYLAFRVGSEEYGVPILDVQEIRQFETPTKIATAPAHSLGILNLRGTIVPITDLSQVLLQRKTEKTDATVTVFCTSGGKLHGLVVDAVNDVISPSEAQIKSAPEMAGSGGADKTFSEIACLEGGRNVLLTSVAAFLDEVGH